MDDVNPSKHIYPRVDSYETTFDDEEYKNAYLQLLLDNYDREACIPKENEDQFQDVVDDYDVFADTVEKAFEKTGDNTDMVNKDEALQLFNDVSGKSQYGWKLFLSEMKRAGIAYDRAKKKKTVKGCFLGLKLIGG